MGELSKLNALVIKRMSKPGRYGDGGGLYLQVSKTGTKSWLFRFMIRKVPREMGLGSLNAISLAEAREKAANCRRQVANGTDPLEAKAALAKERALKSASLVSFAKCSSIFIEVMGEKWKNPKHRAQWSSTLETYAFPIIENVGIGDVDTGMVLRILEPIWRTKTETASRVRGRVEAVLDYAAAKGWRSRENPARWRGHLDKLLPKPSEVTAVEHHKALKIGEVSRFYNELRSKLSLTASALELLVLTVLRPGELVGARWEEIDLNHQVWIVPGQRMKKKLEHRIPLSARACEVLSSLSQRSASQFVFPGSGKSNCLTTASLLGLVKDMRPELDLTSHGFRSTFKDWASEHTSFPADVSEMALAHKVKSKVEAAYRRGDLFLKRRKLMEAWSTFCQSDNQLSTVIEVSFKPA